MGRADPDVGGFKVQRQEEYRLSKAKVTIHPRAPSLTLRAFVARNGPLDHFVCLRQTAPHVLVRPLNRRRSRRGRRGLRWREPRRGSRGRGAGSLLVGALAAVGIWPWKMRRKMPGASMDSGLVLMFGLFHIAGGGIGDAENALAFLRREKIAQQRNIAQHRIDAAGRHQRALQRQGAVRPVDIAVRGGADRPAGRRARRSR